MPQGTAWTAKWFEIEEPYALTIEKGPAVKFLDLTR